MSRDLDAASRTTYERFLEFERLMKVYPTSTYQHFNPTPLGFCAFALTLFVFSMHNAGATVPVLTTVGVAIGLALFYGGLIQLVPGLLECRVRNNFYALTFCSYAGFWFGLGSLYLNLFSFTSVYGDATVKETAFGIFYLSWTIFTAAMLISAIRTNLFSVLLFFCLTVTYILLAASNFLMVDPNLSRAAEVFGILTAAIGWYGAFASVHKKSENSYLNLPVSSLQPKAPINKPIELSSVKTRSYKS